MDEESKKILRDALMQAVENSTKETNDYPPRRAYFLTNSLRKQIQPPIDLSIEEKNGKIQILIHVSNYKRPPILEIERIFREGTFWVAFFDVEEYKDIQTNIIIDFEKRPLEEQIAFFKKHLK